MLVSRQKMSVDSPPLNQQFSVLYHLIHLGYFLGLEKCILVPQLVVPYLGFLSDSVAQMLHMLPDKKALGFSRLFEKFWTVRL